jgi:hypothetical protein
LNDIRGIWYLTIREKDKPIFLQISAYLKDVMDKIREVKPCTNLPERSVNK